MPKRGKAIMARTQMDTNVNSAVTVRVMMERQRSII